MEEIKTAEGGSLIKIPIEDEVKQIGRAHV